MEETSVFEAYHFLNLLIDDGMSAIIVQTKLLNIDKDGFTVRHACHGIYRPARSPALRKYTRLKEFHY